MDLEPCLSRVTILISQWVMHRDPRYFDKPEEFNPDRWDGDRVKKLPTFAYYPFGGGPRFCIGKSFAMMEGVLLLATIAQKYRMTLVPAQEITPSQHLPCALDTV